MHFASNSTCINFLTLMDYSPCSKMEIWPNLKRSEISKTRRATLTKLVCLHFVSTSICMNFLSQFYFLTPWTIVHGPKGNFGHFWRQAKRNQISETRGAMPTKLGLHAFQVNLYLHEFFELILYFDPHGL